MPVRARKTNGRVSAASTASPVPRGSGRSRVWLVVFPLVMFAAGLIVAACSGTGEMHLPNFAAAPPGASPLHGIRQIVVVTSSDWDSIDGRLQTWERAGEGTPWAPASAMRSIVVGRNGMGWGRGLHKAQRTGGPIAREGDGRAPAGVFALGPAFGYAAADEVPGLKIPYFQEIETTECVDDVRSRFYNKIVDRSSIPDPDWRSSEQMAEQGESYRWGIVIKQNDPPEPGGGSCIFLHPWSGPRSGTAGCTGADPAHVEALMHWLDRDSKPALVQLPRAEYERVRTAWQLPPLSP